MKGARNLLGKRSGLVVALVALILMSAACAGADSEAVPPEEPADPGAETTLAPPATGSVPAPTGSPAGPTPTSTPTVEERIAEVEWPGSMRVGDGEVVRLSLAVSPDEGYLVTPEIAGHDVETQTVPVPVERAGYDGYVSASLVGAELEVEAVGPARQRLAPGLTNTWRWTVSAPRAGTYQLVLDLSVAWEPQSGSNAAEAIQEPVWSRVLTVETRAPLGLSGAQADWLGLGGSVVGTVAGLPFVEKVLSTLWGRLRGRRHKTVAGSTD